MRLGYIKNYIVFMFLAIFFMMKMAGLHSLVHEDDKDHYAHCVVCDHLLKSHDNPETLLSNTEFTFLAIEPIPQGEILKDYGFLVNGVLTIGQLFSRPPPNFI